MIRAIRAEFARLTRRRLLFMAAVAAVVFGLGGAAVVLASAKPAAETTGSSRAPTIESLSGSGGGTEVFRFAASFAGTLVFVVFTGLFALEFARGTYRTMLLRQPLRIRLLAGKMAALLAFAAVLLAVIEIVMWLSALVLAPGDVSTGAWTGTGALGSAVTDYLMVLVWVTGYAVLGMTIAVVVRSVPVALAIGIAWAGPIEHLVGDAWSPGSKVFPGLLLEIVGQGGTADVSVTRATVTVAGYILVAAAISAAVFARRDITS